MMNIEFVEARIFMNPLEKLTTSKLSDSVSKYYKTHDSNYTEESLMEMCEKNYKQIY